MDLLERTKRELAKQIHWSKKAIVIKIYHLAKLEIDKRWSCADTARDLGYSRAFISESIKLCDNLTPEIKELSRKYALVRIRS